ncbi:MAG: type I-F CRISPR-associated protein Csy2 [Gammaproteobacteria bacterium]|nr:type I-F CRISPR-associated protein Csy2 [Gammaproteobacteria bacterium]
MKKILIIPRIKIQNANALSSPYTIGFPAMTAWLGAMHALQRKLNAKNDAFTDLKFNSVAVVSHAFNLHTYKGSGDFNHSIISTSNPLKKDGKRPSTIEEARCHLTVSLLVEYSGIDQDEAQDMLEPLSSLLYCMKIASGDVLDFKTPQLIKIKTEQETHKLMTKLMPGFCLIERRDLVQAAMIQGLDGMDALLEYLKINSNCDVAQKKEGENDKIEWLQTRKHSGWLVPIAVGFQGITDLFSADNQRNPEVQHRFAESVVTLGEFIMASRIDHLDKMLWHYARPENGLYLCKQNQPFTNTLEQ